MVYKDLSVVYKDASANTMDNEDHPMYAHCPARLQGHKDKSIFSSILDLTLDPGICLLHVFTLFQMKLFGLIYLGDTCCSAMSYFLLIRLVKVLFVLIVN